MTDDRARYIPPAFGRPVETGKDALEAAACLLEEEGRWTRHSWYLPDVEDLNAQQPEDDPFCGNWGACLDGALRIVTIGLGKKTQFVDEDMEPAEGCLCDSCNALRRGSDSYVLWNHRWDGPEPEGVEAYTSALAAWSRYTDDTYPYGLDAVTRFNDSQPPQKGRDKVVDACRRVAASIDG